MEWISVTFKMPKEELQELREFISEWSEKIPGLSRSRMIRRALEYESEERSEEQKGKEGPGSVVLLPIYLEKIERLDEQPE